jgi:hypothetical protein
MRIRPENASARALIRGPAPPIRAELTAVSGGEDDVASLVDRRFDYEIEWVLWICAVATGRDFRLAVENRPGVYKNPRSGPLWLGGVGSDIIQRNQIGHNSVGQKTGNA